SVRSQVSAVFGLETVTMKVTVSPLAMLFLFLAILTLRLFAVHVAFAVTFKERHFEILAGSSANGLSCNRAPGAVTQACAVVVPETLTTQPTWKTAGPKPTAPPGSLVPP